MGRFVLVGLLGGVAAWWGASCQGPDELFRNTGATGTGGIVVTGTGGVPGTGGIVSTGGMPGTGGIVSTGGVPGTGGRATGGVTGTGGIVSTGGATGTGGRATGGATGTGGIIGTGGATGTGGIVGTGGTPGTGGIVGTGGATGTGGAGGAVGANCADTIVMNGYSAGGSSCSTCMENGADKSMNCKNVIMCLDTHYPCGSANNCALQCNNSGAADSVVSQCVNAILTAGNCVQP
ncbi:MAG TPA: hypothetical protein VHO06_03100 [Polyangia bacterium]|nr:hypothetical protein [Polyangia bacterium]